MRRTPCYATSSLGERSTQIPTTRRGGDSANNLSEPLDAVRHKIVGDGRAHPGVLLRMMELDRQRCAETLLAYAEAWAATA